MKINIKVPLTPGVDDDIIMYFSADSTIMINRKVKGLIREHIKNEKGDLSIEDKLSEILQILRRGNYQLSTNNIINNEPIDSSDMENANNNLDNLLKGFK
jgi:hypothetical protein